MRWSQLKIHMESFFADSVKGRVELRMTRYHNAPDQMGRGWITIDKKQIINLCDYDFGQKWWGESMQRLNAPAYSFYHQVSHLPGYHDVQRQVYEDLHQQGVMSKGDFSRTLRDYLQTSIDEILVSPNVIMRALGMLDRRVGKARLAKMSMDGQPPIVRQLYEFRCQAEGLDPVVDQLDLFWRQHVNCQPLGYRLRVALPQRWFRIHTLPESKRYPEDEAEYQEILRRHNILLTDLFGEGTEILLLLPVIAFTKERPEGLKFPVQPGDVFWRTEPITPDDPDTSFAHFYIRKLQWHQQIVDDLLRLMADDKLTSILFVGLHNHVIYCPYDGGGDVIAANELQRDQLHTKYSPWLSKHPSGM